MCEAEKDASPDGEAGEPKPSNEANPLGEPDEGNLTIDSILSRIQLVVTNALDRLLNATLFAHTS